MYITNTTTISNNTPIKKKAKAGAGGFADLVSGSEGEAQETNAPASTSSLNSLLFMQEVGDEEITKKRVIKQGFDTLKYLDNIRMGLLSGNLSKETILGLESLINNIRTTYTDPKLSEILDEIELRARVELAKLESN